MMEKLSIRKILIFTFALIMSHLSLAALSSNQNILSSQPPLQIKKYIQNESQLKALIAKNETTYYLLINSDDFSSLLPDLAKIKRPYKLVIAATSPVTITVKDLQDLKNATQVESLAIQNNVDLDEGLTRSALNITYILSDFTTAQTINAIVASAPNSIEVQMLNDDSMSVLWSALSKIDSEKLQNINLTISAEGVVNFVGKLTNSKIIVKALILNFPADFYGTKDVWTNIGKAASHAQSVQYYFPRFNKKSLAAFCDGFASADAISNNVSINVQGRNLDKQQICSNMASE